MVTDATPYTMESISSPSTALTILNPGNHLAPWARKSMDIIQDALRNVYSLPTSGGEPPLPSNPISTLPVLA